MRGIVKWYDKNKGYGFIIPELNDDKSQKVEDVFVHESKLREGVTELVMHQFVTFDAIKTTKGFQAINVEPETF